MISASSTAKTATLKIVDAVIDEATEEIPGLGIVLGILADLLFETSFDGESAHYVTLEELRQEAEKICKKQIDKIIWDERVAKLKGWNNGIDNYSNACKNITESSDKSQKNALKDNFISLATLFLTEIDEFKIKGHEIQLLPLCAQAVNLYHVLLLDALKHGKDTLNMDDETIDRYRADLDKSIADNSVYVAGTCEAAMKAEGYDPSETRCQLAYDLTLNARDFVTIWKAMASDAKPTIPVLSRELFSVNDGQRRDARLGAIGNPPNPGWYAPPPAGMRLTQISYGWVRPRYQSPGADCMSAHYGDAYHTPWMGNTSGAVIDVMRINIDPKRAVHYLEVGPIGDFHYITGVRYRDEKLPSVPDLAIEVPDGHYVSSINMMSVYDDDRRGHLINDVVRQWWVGMKYDQELAQPIKLPVAG